jgi:hypothetical protein
MRFVKAAIVATVLMWTVPATAQAQARVSDNDIQRLQEQVYQASNDIARLRADADTTERFEAELDELRDEVIYLRVKMRKGADPTRAEYADVRDRLQAFRSKVRAESTGTASDRGWGTPGTPGGSVGSGTSGGTGSSTGSNTGGSNTGYGSGRDRQRDTTYPDDRTTSRDRQRGNSAIPDGQEIDVRLTNALSSDTAQVEDRFEATTEVDLSSGNTVLIPAGSVVRGVVSSVNRATRTDRKGSLTVSFDQITIRGRTYPMRGTVTEAIESEGMRGEAARIGAGSAIGGIIGGIIGGVKGAVLGVLIGGGGTIAATEGKDVTLPPGTILRVRLDDPPAVR